MSHRSTIYIVFKIIGFVVQKKLATQLMYVCLPFLYDS